MEFHDIQDTETSAINDNKWHGIVNSDEIPSDIDNLLSNYFKVDNSTFKQGNVASSEGDLPLLCPNTLQILYDLPMS
jgi:hypothetical protein